MTYTIDDLGTKIASYPRTKKRQYPRGRPWRADGRAAYMRNAIKTHHMRQVHTLITKLKSIPEGNGTLFDNTTIIYMPETGAGHHGPDNEAPMVLLSGVNSKLDLAGRYIRLPFHGKEGHKTLSKLVHYLTKRLR